MRRNLTKIGAKWGRELIGKLYIKKNTGAYGAVALPQSSNAIVSLADSNITAERDDEQSTAKSQGRTRLVSTRQKGRTKFNISSYLDYSGSPAVEWGIGVLLELLLGKRTVVASTVGATASLQDPSNVKAGLIITTAGAYDGHKGNQVDIKFVRGGATGSASLDATKAPHYVVTYYDNDPVSEIVAAIDGDANLACIEDANGDDTTDLFVDLLVASQRASGTMIQCSHGANAGFKYDNSVLPSADATILHARERAGEVLTGSVIEKLSVEIGDKAPTAKFEGQARLSKLVGVTTASLSVSSANKIYIEDEKQFAAYDSQIHQYVDVVDNDGVTKKASARRLIAKGYDTGHFIEVDGAPFSCDAGDYVAFHEPEVWNPKIAPLNGMDGALTIDGIGFDKIKSLKLDISNNHQLFDNLALSKTIEGFSPSKFMDIKLQAILLVEHDKLALFRSASGEEVFSAPVIIDIGSVEGKKISVVLSKVQFKYPNLSNKGEEVVEVTLDAESISSPETDVPDVYILTH